MRTMALIACLFVFGGCTSDDTGSIPGGEWPRVGASPPGIDMKVEVDPSTQWLDYVATGVECIDVSDCPTPSETWPTCVRRSCWDNKCGEWSYTDTSGHCRDDD